MNIGMNAFIYILTAILTTGAMIVAVTPLLMWQPRPGQRVGVRRERAPAGRQPIREKAPGVVMGLRSLLERGKPAVTLLKEVRVSGGGSFWEGKLTFLSWMRSQTAEDSLADILAVPEPATVAFVPAKAKPVAAAVAPVSVAAGVPALAAAAAKPTDADAISDLFSAEIEEENDAAWLAATLPEIDVPDLLAEAQSMVNELNGIRGG